MHCVGCKAPKGGGVDCGVGERRRGVMSNECGSRRGVSRMVAPRDSGALAALMKVSRYCRPIGESWSRLGTRISEARVIELLQAGGPCVRARLMEGGAPTQVEPAKTPLSPIVGWQKISEEERRGVVLLPCDCYLFHLDDSAPQLHFLAFGQGLRYT